MKVLWITNILFPEVQALLTGGGELKASGGWMLGAADMLVKQTDIHLTIATVCDNVKSLQRLEGERIVYYLLPYGKGNDKYNPDYERYWLEIQKIVHPDVVHIHGTEFTHGLAYIRACSSKNVVVSIQGLVSVCSKYYSLGITKEQIFRNFTFRSFLGRGILKEKKQFASRGKWEHELIKSVDYIIGRTYWDKTHAWALNSRAHYFHVGETLRDSFYDGEWAYNRCIQHSIFLSQGSYPLKGLHMILKALPLILREFPDTVLRIAGKDITRHNSLREFLAYTDYGRIIRNMIKKLSLEENVFFTGPLDMEGMKEEYLRTNVFVCPSSIENSPNSLGEAQVLGVPVVAAYVGGIPDMMKGDEGHLYRYDEIEILARIICDIFKARDCQPQVDGMRVFAKRRHDPKTNCEELIRVYHFISGIKSCGSLEL